MSPLLSFVPRRLATAALALALLQGTAMAAGLAPLERQQLAGARDSITAEAVVIAAVARSPNDTVAIVGEAVAVSPQHANAIVAAVSRAFPGYAGALRGIGPTPQVTAPARASAASRTASRTSGPAASGGEPAPPSSPWSGEVSLGAIHSSGNTESSDVTAALGLTYERGRFDSTSNLTFDRSEEAGDTTARRFVANNDSRYDIAPRVFVANFLEYRNDRFSGFDYEITENPGLGYKIVDRDDLKLSAQAGPAVRLTKQRASGDSDTEVGGRASANLDWTISESATLSNLAEVTVTDERTVSKNLLTISADLIGRLDGRLSFEVRNDSSPPTGTEKTDTVTRASLVYAF